MNWAFELLEENIWFGPESQVLIERAVRKILVQASLSLIRFANLRS